MQWFESERVTTANMSDRLNFTIWMKGPLHVSSDVQHVTHVLFLLEFTFILHCNTLSEPPVDPRSRQKRPSKSLDIIL